MTAWPARWDTTLDIRHYDPATGKVVKITVEQEVTIDGDDTTGNIGEARMAAKYAAIEAFRRISLNDFITDGAIDGTDPDRRLHIDTNLARRKETTT